MSSSEDRHSPLIGRWVRHEGDSGKILMVFTHAGETYFLLSVPSGTPGEDFLRNVWAESCTLLSAVYHPAGEGYRRG